MSSLSRLLHRTFSTSKTPPQPNPNTIESISTALYKECNLHTLVDKFKSSCDNDRFRTKTSIYVFIVRHLASVRKITWIKEILEHQKHYTHDISKDVLLRALFLSRLYKYEICPFGSWLIVLHPGSAISVLVSHSVGRFSREAEFLVASLGLYDMKAIVKANGLWIDNRSLVVKIANFDKKKEPRKDCFVNNLTRSQNCFMQSKPQLRGDNEGVTAVGHENSSLSGGATYKVPIEVKT
ncbi:hypothetical protein Vadar_009862 [Vaccinium darrowii]|uniref:Uncharacterized protein n=1 Tax=Vaccinium darrowii TaxID=229202 RepID=A0ACB7XPL6_9ERIC|nr:hypothetical protein Vadar_009862 [Vaccinium darrowii]